MKSALVLLCCMVTLAFADENDAGHFMPKSFYKIDSTGHKSNVHEVNSNVAHYLRRLRRDSVSSSSSSSSSSSNGGPTFFTSQQVVQHTPDVSVASRFGGVPESVGHVVQTSGIVDNSGRVHYMTQHGQIGGSQYRPTYHNDGKYRKQDNY